MVCKTQAAVAISLYNTPFFAAYIKLVICIMAQIDMISERTLKVEEDISIVLYDAIMISEKFKYPQD